MMPDCTEINMKGARLCGHKPFIRKQMMSFSEVVYPDKCGIELVFDIRTIAEDREAVMLALMKRGWGFRDTIGGRMHAAKSLGAWTKYKTEDSWPELIAACLEVEEV